MTSQALDRFLASIERRAYRMAYIASGNRDDALDIVQDSMLKLAQNYADRSIEDWGPLFHRILQSTIRDWYRRQKVRNQWRTWLEFTKAGTLQRAQKDSADIGSNDAPGNVMDLFEDAHTEGPVIKLVNERTIEALEQALHLLPLRQQQAFLLRVLEGLSVEETAQAMGCTAGSVKTHFSRAVHTLRQKLEDHRL
ncbi:MAG: RNA polymerase sigma factor [Gammaproteobacteria bacterium]|nr:RNA polymerase sigma factor [Gammaproteobacteria bacterium]